MSRSRPILARALVIAAFLAIASPGCGPPQVANAPEQADFGALEEVGSLYIRSSNVRKKPPASVKDLSGGRDLFMQGYNAVEQGDVVVNWGVPAAPGDAGKGSEQILAYQKDVPSKGGPVLMTTLEVRTMSTSEFAAAPKPASAPPKS